MDRAALAKVLQTWRRDSGFYQKEAAAKLSISRTYFDKLESGKGNPSFDLLSRICRFANVKFYPGSADVTRYAKICALCKFLSNRNRNTIVRMIKTFSKR